MLVWTSPFYLATLGVAETTKEAALIVNCKGDSSVVGPSPVDPSLRIKVQLHSPLVPWPFVKGKLDGVALLTVSL